MSASVCESCGHLNDSPRAVTLTAGQAQLNDVVLAPDGNVYQYSGDGQWLHMDLVLTESGPLWQPAGQLVLLVRGGQPQAVLPGRAHRG